MDKVTPSQASAIVDVARLAASADGHVAPDEVATITLAGVVYEMAGLRELPSPNKSMFDSASADIGAELEDIGPRELAFAGAVAVVIDDGITQEEQGFVKNLAEALVLDEARANELVGIDLKQPEHAEALGRW